MSEIHHFTHIIRGDYIFHTRSINFFAITIPNKKVIFSYLLAEVKELVTQRIATSRSGSKCFPKASEKQWKMFFQYVWSLLYKQKAYVKLLIVAEHRLHTDETTE